MTLIHDDYPHRVPTRAWLRWRENWLYFLVDVERNIIITAHMSLQPTFGIARYAVNMIIDGERTSMAEEVPCPENFEYSHCLKLGELEVKFIEPHKVIDIAYDGPSHSFKMRLEATLPMFDYAACIDTNPDDYSLSESTSLGFGAFRHHNQSMAGQGSLTIKDKQDRSIEVCGVGYRDHSWGMRDDTMTLEHVWAWASFPGKTVHITRVLNRLRPTSWVTEGYLGTAAGNCALNKCESIFSGESEDNLPGTVRLVGVDADGTEHTVLCNLTQAFARNRFLSQQPGKAGYLMKHTFCPATCEATGENGIALVEIGKLEQPGNTELSQG